MDGWMDEETLQRERDRGDRTLAFESRSDALISALPSILSLSFLVHKMRVRDLYS